MRLTAVLTSIILFSGAAEAATRHLILEPAGALSDDQRAELAARGVQIEKALTDGRLLVRVPDVESVASFGRVESLTAERKVFRSALREATSGRAFARVNVAFHEGVAFEEARRVVESSGGTLRDPLQLGFMTGERIAALVPATAVMTLAADDRVMAVHGERRFRQVIDNANAALLSNVKAIQEAPYGLTGQGVVLSFFELAAAFAEHQEFGGRLTTHFTGGSSSDVAHATHVSGTMIASGTDPAAKGMAPAATLHEYSSQDDDFLRLKENLLEIKSVADNNSWGYVIGWCGSPSCSGWQWDDTADFYGYYDAEYTAPLDRVSRTTGVLYMHSAGNDAEKIGPQDLWGTHAHSDNNGDRIANRTYCYSRDNTGNDCPAPACTAGFCETVKHPRMSGQLPDPWISIGLTASAKNILTVGAVDSDRIIASFSSRGPARDGRVKPEIVARGVSVYSAIPGGTGNAHTNKNGTSMSTPVVTGTAALLTEQWRRTFAGADPGPTVLKTVIIAGAQDLAPAGPDFTFGFGLLDAKAAADLIIADGAQGRRIKQSALAQGAQYEVPVTVTSLQTLRVTLGWEDPPVYFLASDSLSARTLVNDLDVKVIDPAGNTILPYVLDATRPDVAATTGVNAIDTTEMVEVKNAAPGTYRVIVSGTRITADSPQKFVLISNADTGVPPVPCTEILEPNDSESQAVRFVASDQTLTARTCAAGDVDYYSFVTTRSGAVRATVTSTGTPLRVTISGAGISPVSADVPTNGTQSVAAQAPTPGTLFVKVEAAGPVGASASYSLMVTYPETERAPRRSVRR